MSTERLTRRDVLAAALASGAFRCCPGSRRRPTAPISPPARPSRSRSTPCAPWRGGWRSEPYAPPPVARHRAAREHRLRPAQPDQLPPGPHALGGRSGGAPRCASSTRGATSRSRCGSMRSRRHGARDPVLDRALRHARRTTRRASSGAGFAGFRVMDPDAEERLDGGARRLLLPHLGLFRAVRPVGARARHRRRRRPGPRSFPASPASGSSRPRRRHHRSTRCSRARARPAPTASPRLRDGGVFQDVDADIFLRGDVDRLGIAPLTSMYWFGKHNHYVAPDWRPEVHDSDGLELLLANGERIWRPLNNPPRPMANSFAAEGLRASGSPSASAASSEYQDDGVFYEKRATVWVEPQGRLGRRLGDAGGAPDQRRDPRQHRRLLGARRAGGGRQRVRPVATG